MFFTKQKAFLLFPLSSINIWDIKHMNIFGLKHKVTMSAVISCNINNYNLKYEYYRFGQCREWLKRGSSFLFGLGFFQLQQIFLTNSIFLIYQEYFKVGYRKWLKDDCQFKSKLSLLQVPLAISRGIVKVVAKYEQTQFCV